MIRGDCEPRQVDGKDASLIRQIARVDPPIVRVHGQAAEGEAETEAAPIRVSLLERAEQLIHVPSRQTAAFIQDLDEHTLGAGRGKRHVATAAFSSTVRRRLPSVALAPTRRVTVVRGRVNLNAFCNRFSNTAARTCRSASITTRFDGNDDESDALGVGLQGCGGREFFDEIGQLNWLPLLDAVVETEFGERTINESV